MQIKPRLHERFFACDGDAIFFKLSRRQHAVKIPRVATLAQAYVSSAGRHVQASLEWLWPTFELI